MMGLTEREKRAYDFIAHRLRETAIAPTLAEIAAFLGCCKSSVHLDVSRLVACGRLRRLPGRKQALEVIKPARVKYFRFDDDTKQFVEWRP